MSTPSITTRFQTLLLREHEEESEQKAPAKIHANPFPLYVQTNQASSKDNTPTTQAVAKPFPSRRSNGQVHTIPTDSDHTIAASDSEEDDSLEIVQSLTQRLEGLKRQKEELCSQIEDEEADAKTGQAELLRERDLLKHELKEKEDNSNEMRKQGNHLEKLNRTAQNKKSAKEKTLSQKQAERQKAMDDVERWDVDSLTLQQQVDIMETELNSAAVDHDQQLQHLRQMLDIDQSTIKGIEEEIRVKGSQIKDLEQRNGIHNEGFAMQSGPHSNQVKDEAWQSRIQALHVQIQSLWNALHQSKLEEQYAEERLCCFSTKQRSPLEDIASNHPADNLLSASRVRLQPGVPTHSRSSTHPPSIKNFAVPAYSNPSEQYVTATSHLLGSMNTARPQPLDGISDLLPTSTEELSHGGMMSPDANDLLPSYLLGDDDLLRRPSTGENFEAVVDSRFTQHAFTNSDVSAQGPNTPLSENSRRGSIITSPHGSLQNVSSFNPEHERHPKSQISVTHASDQSGAALQQSGSKFANIFSSPFGRQRVKSGGPEPPALGTLKQGQSQSFPRNFDDEAGDTSGLRRRRGSHGAWASPVAGLIGKVGIQNNEVIARARASSGRSGRLNMFKSRLSNLESGDFDHTEAINSRPSSTYSFDHQLRRPSSENPSIWGPTSDGIVRRDSPMNAIWSGAAGPWSRDASRRESIQHSSSTNLSLGSTPFIPDDSGRIQPKHRAEQAPIGTRPALQRVVTPKLNPAAPSFKTLFSRSDTRKVTRAEKAVNKRSAISKSRESEKSDVETNDTQDESSPRLSRDAQSITTATSTADSHDSVEKGTSGTTSDSPTPKESLMQKITRKSSSSKFNVPWSKDRGMFSKRAGEFVLNDNDMETPLEAHDAKIHENISNNQREEKPSRAWASIRRKSKRGTETADQESDLGDDET